MRTANPINGKPDKPESTPKTTQEQGRKEETKSPPPAPQPSQIDKERADWEGMGQQRYTPPKQDTPSS